MSEKKNKGGRPPKDHKPGPKTNYKQTPEILALLDSAFAIDASNEQAARYAGIDPDTLYRWMRENPKLSERFEKMKDTTPLKALRHNHDIVEKDATTMRWYLERRDERFSPKSEQKHTGSIKVQNLADLLNDDDEEDTTEQTKAD